MLSGWRYLAPGSRRADLAGDVVLYTQSKKVASGWQIGMEAAFAACAAAIGTQLFPSRNIPGCDCFSVTAACLSSQGRCNTKLGKPDSIIPRPPEVRADGMTLRPNEKGRPAETRGALLL